MIPETPTATQRPVIMNRHCLVPPPTALDEDRFVATYGDVYEHSPWIARDTWRRGLTAAQDTAEGLSDAMAGTLAAAPAERQVELIRAHPDLAGKAAVAGALSADSSREQAGAGIGQCTPEEFERFQRLNLSYRRRFDFPFVMAVRGFDRHQILRAFETRLANSPAAERVTAMEQINRIARLRLIDRAQSQ